MILKRIEKENICLKRGQAFVASDLDKVGNMLKNIHQNGDRAILEYARSFDELGVDNQFVIQQQELESAFYSLSAEDQAVLTRTADRIRNFAEAQKQSLSPVSMQVNGGYVGHDIVPIEIVGCYAPGGRFPLPSSVLMTVIPARVAGARFVILSSPKPTQHTLAAAFVAGADIVLSLGGVQAIGAMAYGTNYSPSVHMIAGPGNRWVTAAKFIVSEFVGIDMLAGPSELLILADEDQDASIIAADLLAQAEHDDDALPIFVTTSPDLFDRVNKELEAQLITLPTKDTAMRALHNGFAVVVDDMQDGIDISNQLAAEHLQILTKNPEEISAQIKHAGAIFLGAQSAEVIGDYGAGPNHTLPTGGTATYKAGLSVFTFLRTRTWIKIDNQISAKRLYSDSSLLGRMEGLEAHARAADKRQEVNHDRGK